MYTIEKVLTELKVLFGTNALLKNEPEEKLENAEDCETCKDYDTGRLLSQLVQKIDELNIEIRDLSQKNTLLKLESAQKNAYIVALEAENDDTRKALECQNCKRSLTRTGSGIDNREYDSHGISMEHAHHEVYS